MLYVSLKIHHEVDFFFMELPFWFHTEKGARCSSVVRAFVHGTMGRRIDPSWGGLIELFLHDWCNTGRSMCYPVYGMVDIKEPLLLIGKRSPCGGSGFPLTI